MPSASTQPNPSILSYPAQDTSKDSLPPQDTRRYGLAKPITTNRSLDDDSHPLSAVSRKRSIPGHSAPTLPRALPYPPSRPAQRRPSNTPSASVSTTRRPSLPGLHAYPPPSPHSLTPSYDPSAIQPPPLHSSDNDLYSGLSSFTFGAPNNNSQPQPLSSDPAADLISPLTRLSESSSETPTPRPSLSGPSGIPHLSSPSTSTSSPPSSSLLPPTPKTRSGKQKSKDVPPDPDIADDELDDYDDEDAANRHRRRSKMRAIDDGSRRPSLPANIYPPVHLNKSASASPPPSHLHPTHHSQRPQPSGGASPHSPSDLSTGDSELSPDEPEQADFDTDVEFDPPLPDNASQHTFGGGGGFDHYGYRRSMLPDPEEREEYDDELPSEPGYRQRSSRYLSSWSYRDSTVSPGAYGERRFGYESDDATQVGSAGTITGGRFPTSAGRRGSAPWKIPGATSPREREDSTVTIKSGVPGRRGSRSADDESGPSQLSPHSSSVPQTRSDFQGLGGHPLEAPAEDEEEGQITEGTESEPASNVYEGLDMDYIFSGSMTVAGENPRRSWSSGAPSYVQTDRMRHPESSPGEALSWMWSGPEGRRPSTITVGTTSEDVFTRHLRKNDLVYNERRLDWSFKKESKDGRGPRSSTSQGEAPEQPDGRMNPGTQEIWRQAYIGRFKVDRLLIKSDQPDKAPQQRVNIRHIVDPYSKGNVQGGPSSVIHKHSRAAAFSIFRTHSLFKKSGSTTTSHMSTSISILLATRRVQEQYTSTRTTAKLNSHGLLEDKPRKAETRGQPATHNLANLTRASSSRRPDERTGDGARSSKGKSKDDIEYGIGTSNQTRSAASSASVYSVQSAVSESGHMSSPHRSPPTVSSVPSSPTLRHGHSHAFSLASESTSETLRMSHVESTLTKPATISEYHPTQSRGSFPSRQNSTDTMSHGSNSLRSRSEEVEEMMDLDDDDEQSPPRTSHAEAFATVDSSYIEYLRGKAESRNTEHDSSSQHIFGAIRRRFLGQGHAKTSPKPNSGGGAPHEGGLYTPPWVTMASRSKQEERERVIQTLNESFKDVGLLPSFRNKQVGSGKNSKRKKNNTRSDVFGPALGDCLYMLLPLWPGETDPVSKEKDEDPEQYIVPVVERQYLLVYYSPFAESTKKKGDNKKRTRAETAHGSATSTVSVPTGIHGPNIALQAFRVCARLVNYTDMRETGVRLPDCGLSVTGSMIEAKRYLPPKEIREMALDDIVIGICHTRQAGMEFLPEGLVKLGLTMQGDVQIPLPREEDEVPELDVQLTPIGRAAVEMAWLGCMAVTCFATD